MSDGFESGAII